MPVLVHPLDEDEFEVFAERAAFRPREVHAERAIRQHLGEATYLAAWVDEEPVGWVLLEHRGAAGYHEIRDLYVSASRRGQGIGSMLMDAAEAEAARQCATSVGLFVRMRDVVPLEMYRRRGYQDAGLAPRFLEFENWNEDGSSYEVAEVHHYLRKELRRMGQGTPREPRSVPPIDPSSVEDSLNDEQHEH